jgi:uncharacterized membrane protein
MGGSVSISVSATASPRISRIDSLDTLRGAVMVLMVLDHVRCYLTNARFDPCDLSRSTAALFLTRWVTHFCAPVFLFLAGVGAGLWQIRHGATRDRLAVYLLSRGLWLIVLKFTLVHIGWWFQFGYTHGPEFLVIWCLGASMLCLAGLVFLPRRVVFWLSLAVIAGHHLLEPVSARHFGAFAPLWRLLHEPGVVFDSAGGFVIYPLIPWAAVMAAGYALAPSLTVAREVRCARLLRWAGVCVVLFLVIRTVNRYGDPAPWSHQADTLFTFLSFINVSKYPASLLYLLITLGPAFAAMAWWDGASGRWSRWMTVFGRVPLFFYLLHIYLAHMAALFAALLIGYPPGALMASFMSYPPDFGFGLPVVYAVWLAIVIVLYFPCRWFAALKRSRPTAVWLSYL